MDLKLWPLLVVTAIYALQVGIFVWTRQWREALIFTGYTLANLGVALTLK